MTMYTDALIFAGLFTLVSAGTAHVASQVAGHTLDQISLQLDVQKHIYISHTAFGQI